MNIVVAFLRGCVNVAMFVPRLLSTYSGAVLFWKLITNRNQNGPYSTYSRIYQGIAIFIWLVQILFLAALLLMPNLLMNLLMNL